MSFTPTKKSSSSCWRRTVSPQQHKALRDIGVCRTAALGGHVEECDQCAHRLIAYNSCRNRHCPKCQSTARDRWLARGPRNCSPCRIVMSCSPCPEQTCAAGIAEPAGLLQLVVPGGFRDAAEIAADPGISVRDRLPRGTPYLGPNLLHHPHLHCVVPAGGMAPDGSRWIACRREFFLPVRVSAGVPRKILAF